MVFGSPEYAFSFPGIPRIKAKKIEMKFGGFSSSWPFLKD
jgi:hypothetical protein